VEHVESVFPTALGASSVSGRFPLLSRRKNRRGTDISAANGLAALAWKRPSGIGVAVGSAKNLASNSGSRPGWIFLVRPASRRADAFHCMAHSV
jgi:hypothetical protein